jgi:hypothetical protein
MLEKYFLRLATRAFDTTLGGTPSAQCHRARGRLKYISTIEN